MFNKMDDGVELICTEKACATSVLCLKVKHLE